MIRRKPDSEKKFTTDQKLIPPTPTMTAWLALLFVLLMLITPGPVIDAIKNFLSLPVMPPSESEFPVDKVVHCMLFAACAFLSARAWSGQFKLALIVLMLLLFAAMTEFLQTVIPGRSGDFADFLADALGILLGVWWYRRIKMRT